MLTLHLRDISKEVTAAWKVAFADVPQVHVTCGNILEHPADAIVSPANSFGYMDGGIDAAFLGYFVQNSRSASARSSMSDTMGNCQ
jgi:hypothetical protein